MTREEALEALRGIWGFLEVHGFQVSLEEILAALEAKPLAEMNIDAIYDVAVDGYLLEITLWIEKWPRTDMPVRVAIYGIDDA